MSAYIETLKHALAELVEQRRHIDADIQDLRRIIARHGGDTEEGLATRRSVTRERGRAAPPGEARREVLDLFADGQVWTRGRLAKARGTTPNAAGAMLRRLLSEDPPLIEAHGGGYRLASPKGDDAEGSLSESAERDTQRTLDRG